MKILAHAIKFWRSPFSPVLQCEGLLLHAGCPSSHTWALSITHCCSCYLALRHLKPSTRLS